MTGQYDDLSSQLAGANDVANSALGRYTAQMYGATGNANRELGYLNNLLGSSTRAANNTL